MNLRELQARRRDLERMRAAGTARIIALRAQSAAKTERAKAVILQAAR